MLRNNPSINFEFRFPTCYGLLLEFSRFPESTLANHFCKVQRFFFKGKRIDVINQGKKQALKMLADLIQEKN